MVPLYLAAGVCLGLAVFPGLEFYRLLMGLVQGSETWVRDLAIAVSVGVGYFLYGFSLMVIIPTLNFFVGRGMKPWRGPYYSWPAVKWYLHNGLTYLVRYTFIEMVMPGPFVNWFYKAMGMKLGKGALINTSHISDPSMIEVGDKATIGGSATIVGHYGVGGYLIIAPVKIGKGATIGLKATIMAGTEIGENARILPNSVLLPKTHVPAGETWGGVPAHKIEAASEKHAHAHAQKVEA